MDDEMNYSLYDVNGDAYHIRIKKREAILYDQDHLRCYRRLNQLKRAGARPAIPNSTLNVSPTFAPAHNSTMELMVKHCPSPDPLVEDDLRSPVSKKGRKAGETDLNTSFDLLRCDDDDVLAEPLLNQPTSTPILEYITSWTEDAVHLFINEMGKRIDKIKLKRTPKSVYEDISAVMLSHGFKFDGNALYTKKRGLDTYFCNAKKKGNEKQISWPFFEGMKVLHSGVWPVGFKSAPSIQESADSSGEGETSYHQDHYQEANEWDVEEQGENEHHSRTVLEDEDEAEPVQQVAGAVKKFQWTDDDDNALIEEVSEAKQRFDGNDLVKNVDFFKSVATEMKKRGIDQNEQECMKRYSKLKAKYHEIVDRSGETGRGAIKWPNFQAMYDLEGDSVTTKALVTVSLGGVPKVKKAYEVAATLASQGRQRQLNPKRQQRTQKLMGNNSSVKISAVGYKNRALELQERRLELEREYFNEFRTYSLEAKERGGYIQDGVLVLKDLKRDRDLMRASKSPPPNEK